MLKNFLKRFLCKYFFNRIYTALQSPDTPGGITVDNFHKSHDFYRRFWTDLSIKDFETIYNFFVENIDEVPEYVVQDSRSS